MEKVVLEVEKVVGSNNQEITGDAVGSKDTITIKNKEIKKTKGNYCFPNFLGDAMGKVGQRVQFESSLLSMAFILLGIIIMGFVTVLGTDFSLFIKIMTGANCLAAFLFLSSSLVTTFQQYQAYLSIMGIIDTKEDTINNPEEMIKDNDLI